MYLWNTKALAKELKEGTLSEGEKFKYYLFGVIIYALLFEFGGYLDKEIFTTVNLLLSITIVSLDIIGIYLCYEANKQGDGLLFIERIVCLSVPLGIRILVLSIVLLIIFSIVGAIFSAIFFPDYSANSLADIILTLTLYVISIWFYYRLYKYLKFVSGAESGNTNS